MPTTPTISGTSVRAEVQAYWIPPHVNAMTIALELPMRSTLPLCTTSAPTKSIPETPSLHPVHASNLLLERACWRLHIQEQDNQRGGDTGEWKVQIYPEVAQVSKSEKK